MARSEKDIQTYVDRYIEKRVPALLPDGEFRRYAAMHLMSGHSLPRNRPELRAFIAEYLRDNPYQQMTEPQIKRYVRVAVPTVSRRPPRRTAWGSILLLLLGAGIFALVVLIQGDIITPFTNGEQLRSRVIAGLVLVLGIIVVLSWVRFQVTTALRFARVLLLTVFFAALVIWLISAGLIDLSGLRDSLTNLVE